MISQKLNSSTAFWGSLKDKPTMAIGSAVLPGRWRLVAIAARFR